MQSKDENFMISALAHDIRTPLTEAMLKLELLKDQTEAHAIRKHLEDINQIIKSVLDYSQMGGSINKKPTNLSLLLKRICKEYNTQSFEVAFKTSNHSITANIDTLFLKRLMQNILNNARNYADQAIVSLSTRNSEIILTIEDNGPGVPPNALQKIGTPYYRCDQSKPKNTGGTGLGLAIVKNIVHMHFGKISFENAQKSGFKIIIHLPKKRPA